MEGIVNKDDNGKVDKTITIPSGADLNTIVTSGFYRFGGSAVNAPSGTNHSQMIVSRGIDTVAQIILKYSDAKMYVRTGYQIGQSNPQWTGWYLMSRTAV